MTVNRVLRASLDLEIARYGTLAAWAEKLSTKDGVKLLETTLEEKKETDRHEVE